MLLLLLACAGAEIRLPEALAVDSPVPVEQTGTGTGRIGASTFQDQGHPLPPSEGNVGDAGPEWRRATFSFRWLGVRELDVTCLTRTRTAEVRHVLAVEESSLSCTAEGGGWSLDVSARNEEVGGQLTTGVGAPVTVTGVFDLQNGDRSSEIVGYTIGAASALSLLNRPHVWYAGGIPPFERDALGAAAIALIKWRDAGAALAGHGGR